MIHFDASRCQVIITVQKYLIRATVCLKRWDNPVKASGWVSVLWGHLPGIEDRRFCARVGAYEQDDVSQLHAGDGGVGQVVGAHIRVQIRKARLHLQVAAAQPVCKVLRTELMSGCRSPF